MKYDKGDVERQIGTHDWVLCEISFGKEKEALNNNFNNNVDDLTFFFNKNY